MPIAIVVIGPVAVFLIIFCYKKRKASRKQSHNITQSFSDVKKEKASTDSKNLGKKVPIIGRQLRCMYCSVCI